MPELLEHLLYYLDALWRRRWTALGVAFLVALLGWGTVATLPNKYESQSRIYVDTASVLGPLLQDVAVENDLTRQVQVMRQTLLSRTNLEQVARETDLDLTVRSPAQLEELVEGLRRDIKVEATKSNLFTVTYTANDAQTAQRVVETLTSIFVENNLGRNRQDMHSAQEFLDEQITEYENKLDSAEERLAEFKQRNMNLLPGQEGFQDTLAEVNAKLEETKAELEDARTRRNLLQRELAKTPEMLTQQSGSYGSGPPSDLDVRIAETKATLEDLKSRYTDQHPDVVSTQRKLEGLIEERDAQLAAMDATGPGGSGPGGADGSENAQPSAPAAGEVKIPNPTYGNLRLEVIKEQSKIETLQEQADRLKRSIAGLEEKIQQVPQVEARLKKLTRDYRVIKDKYETLLSRRESARISADRERQEDQVQFRIIDPAKVPQSPVGPNRPLFMAGVLVMSLGAGAGTSWLFALTKVTYGSVNHLRREFDLPVAGYVSELPKRGEWLRRVLDILGLLTVLIAILAVFGALMLIERQVGFHALMEEPLTMATLERAIEALQAAVDNLTGTDG